MGSPLGSSSRAGRTGDVEAAVEGLDPVGKAAQAGAGARARAADAVVGNFGRERGVLPVDPDFQPSSFSLA